MSHRIYRESQLQVRGNRVVGRREFLKSTALAGAAAGALNWTDCISAQAADLRKRGMSCILLWMQGAPSQLETFDPKPGHENGGETKAIDTNVSGIRISANLPEIAKVADKLAIVRSMSTKEGNHQRASYMLHTSYVPTATVRHPSLGSVAAHEIADAACELPAFVRVGQVQNGSNGGFLGTAYDAFDVGGGGGRFAGAAGGGGGMTPSNTTITTSEDRYRRRLNLLDRLEGAVDNPAIAQASADHRKLYDKAARMIMSEQMKAFELREEPQSVLDAYGSGAFASGCLLARRLVETGVTFVEVGLGTWDTHQDNFTACKALCNQLDRPYAALLRDLEQRGMLDRTLVVWMGEFGRTPRINPRGGRDHYPRAFNVVLAGGGVKGGQVIGETTAGGEDVVDSPVSEKDLFQSIYQSLKINTHKEFMSPIGRPIKVVDGGSPIPGLVS